MTSLQKCTAAELDLLRELSIRTYYETFARVNTTENMAAYLEKAFNTEQLMSELNNRNSSFFLLYNDDRPAGYLKLNEAPSQTDIHDAESLEIERIYVLNDFQGIGLGGYLMKRAVAFAKERCKRYVWLGVWEKNEKAIRFYERNGFYKIGSHAFIMGDDRQTDHIMRKDLECDE